MIVMVVTEVETEMASVEVEGVDLEVIRNNTEQIFIIVILTY